MVLKKESDDLFQSILSDARKIKASFEPRRSSVRTLPYTVVAANNTKKVNIFAFWNNILNKIICESEM